MEKNITIVDEQENAYGATYPKRAKGLVKNGRAHFVDENTICLACPPIIDWEDTKMEDNKNTAAVLSEETAEQPTECTMEYVLTRIDRIISDTAYLHEAIQAVERMEPGQPSMNAPADTSRGEAVQAIVQSREATNQQLLRLLEKMYDDLKPAKPDGEMQKLQQLSTALAILPPAQAADILAKSAQQMFVRAGAEIVR